MSGHTHLKASKRTPQWGIGRHVLGSQIYDYWLDPHGQMLEHWTDGDLFNNETPPMSSASATCSPRSGAQRPAAHRPDHHIETSRTITAGRAGFPCAESL